MSEERYKIEVSDECVEITGTLTIREAFDFLNFFEQQGYTTLEDWGERTTLYLKKRDLERERRDEIIRNSVEDLEDYKKRYYQQVDRSGELQKKVHELESMIKTLMIEESFNNQKLRKENEVLIKAKQLCQLQEHPIAKQIIENYFNQEIGAVPPGTEIHVKSFNEGMKEAKREVKLHDSESLNSQETENE